MIQSSANVKLYISTNSLRLDIWTLNFEVMPLKLIHIRCQSPNLSTKQHPYYSSRTQAADATIRKLLHSHPVSEEICVMFSCVRRSEDFEFPIFVSSSSNSKHTNPRCQNISSLVTHNTNKSQSSRGAGWGLSSSRRHAFCSAMTATLVCRVALNQTSICC